MKGKQQSWDILRTGADAEANLVERLLKSKSANNETVRRGYMQAEIAFGINESMDNAIQHLRNAIKVKRIDANMQEKKAGFKPRQRGVKLAKRGPHKLVYE